MTKVRIWRATMLALLLLLLMGMRGAAAEAYADRFVWIFGWNLDKDAARQAATKEFEQEQTEKTEAEKFCQKCATSRYSTAKSHCGVVAKGEIEPRISLISRIMNSLVGIPIPNREAVRPRTPSRGLPTTTRSRRGHPCFFSILFMQSLLSIS